jgi:hypothetical protein
MGIELRFFVRPACILVTIIFLNWYSVGWSPLDTTATNRPIVPRVIMMMEKLVEWLAGETEVLGENLSLFRFIYHKPHMLCQDANSGRRGGKPATNLFSYGTAILVATFTELYKLL